AARHGGPSVGEDAAEEGQVAAHAVASDKVRVADERLDSGDIGEGAIESDIASKRNSERLAGCDSLAGQRRVNELGQDVHAGAGAANGNAPSDERVQSALDGRPLPEIDVVGLIAAGDEQGFGVLHSAGYKWVTGRRSIGNDEGGY